jgi:hypothetical protein
MPLALNKNRGSACKTIHMKMSFSCMSIFMLIKVIFIWMVSHKDLFWSWTPRKLKGSIHMHLTYLARKPSTGPATSKRAVDAVEDLPWAVWRKLRLTIRGSQEQRRSRCLTIRRNGHNENWFQAFVWDWPLLFYEPCFHDSRKPENPLENSTSESHQGDQSCFEKFYTS